MSEFIDVEWFDAGATGHGGQSIGVVLVYDEHVGFKCYMGIGSGLSEEGDMKRIHEWGTKLDRKLAEAVWGSRMGAEWVSRNLANDARLSYAYKYDGKRYSRPAK